MVELEPCLDEPNGIGCSAGSKTSPGSGEDVDDWRVGFQLPIEEFLHLGVGAEVDGSRGRHTDQVRTQASE